MSNGDDAATIRVPTTFTSVDQLVARPGPHVDGEVISAPIGGAKLGEQRWFQVLLADGTVAFEGLGEVITASRVGTRLKIVDLDAESRIVHTRILASKPVRPPTGVRMPPAPFRKPGDATPRPTVDASPKPAIDPASAPIPAPAAVVTTLKSSPPPPAEPAPPPPPAPPTPSLPPPPSPSPSPSPSPKATATATATATAAAAPPVAELPGEWTIPEVVSAASPPPGLPLAAPPEAAAAVALAEPRQPTVEPTMSVVAGWTPPAWMQDRRVKIAGAVLGAILLIGIIASFAAKEPPRNASAGPAPMANTQPAPRAALDAAIADEAVADDTDVEDAGVPEDAAEIEPDAQPPIEPESTPPPPKKKTPPKKTPPPPKKTPPKKTSSSKQVRLDVRSDPAGATIKVNGGSVKGSAMVASGSTVTITATKRGYKRATKTVKVTKSTSVVMKLQKM